ncbi:MAG: hypothetical protein EA402_06720 [Planctomycetota bacterium]|nr:MAG: hypothetical protein EA402_06720 [Planctomycetota bacterium]
MVQGMLSAGRSMILVLGLLLVSSLALAEDRIESLVRQFERGLEQAFSGGRASLDRFRESHRRQAEISLNRELSSSEANDDRLWLAWHLLLINPRHHAARQAFSAAEQTPPLDEQGNFAARNPPPPPLNPALVRLVDEALANNNAAVIEAAQPAIRQYSSRNSGAVRSFIRGLRELRSQGLATVTNPVIAFYFPAEARQLGIHVDPRAPSWMSPPDRYLLNHGLLSAQMGCNYSPPNQGRVLTTANYVRSQGDCRWQFPIPLSHWRLEMVLEPGQQGQAEVSAGGSKLSLGWSVAGLRLSGPQSMQLQLPAIQETSLIHLVVSGDRWAFSLNGARLGEGELPHQAWRQLQVLNDSRASALRLRYLAQGSELLVASALVPATEAAAASSVEPPWRSRLRQDLQQPVAFAFNNIPLGEVINALNLIGPATWHLDDSAKALIELPMFLAGEGMTGEQLLVWFQRLAGLEHRLEERGVVLTW